MKRLCSGLVLCALVACGTPVAPRSSSTPAPPVSSQLPPSPSSEEDAEKPSTGSGLTLADAASCPVTEPVAAPADFAERLFGSSSAFGNASMWVGGLGEGGVIVADSRFVEDDGSIGWKLGWWRIVPGSLAITGRRVDGAGSRLRAFVPDGYGQRGFQASGVSFPTEGCWEVTGTVGDDSLTFVTFVIGT